MSVFRDHAPRFRHVKMEMAEKHAFEYLQSLQRGDVIHEPDGKIPPDFLGGGQIAVEVRRLNQFTPCGDDFVPLDNDYHMVHSVLSEVMNTAGPTIDGATWNVWIHYRRPIGLKAKRLKKEMRSVFDALRNNRFEEDKCYAFAIAETVEISFTRSRGQVGEPFRLLGMTDQDMSGWPLSQLFDSASIAINEKVRKTRPYLERYPEWWLVLVNYVYPALGGLDGEMFQRSLPELPRHSFERIVLIDPSRQHASFDIAGPGATT